jgi:hypothetical protein
MNKGRYPINLREAIDQLRSCHFECDGGTLENNVAFRGLERLADKFPAIAIPEES